MCAFVHCSRCGTGLHMFYIDFLSRCYVSCMFTWLVVVFSMFHICVRRFGIGFTYLTLCLRRFGIGFMYLVVTSFLYAS